MLMSSKLLLSRNCRLAYVTDQGELIVTHFYCIIVLLCYCVYLRSAECTLNVAKIFIELIKIEDQ